MFLKLCHLPREALKVGGESDDFDIHMTSSDNAVIALWQMFLRQSCSWESSYSPQSSSEWPYLSGTGLQNQCIMNDDVEVLLISGLSGRSGTFNVYQDCLKNRIL